MAVDLSDDEKQGAFDMMDTPVSDPPNMLHEVVIATPLIPYCTLV